MSIAPVRSVGNYEISETNVKRDMDLRRFNVQKLGAKKPYIVTMQTRAGRRMQCSCPAGCNQLKCKHLKMVQSAYA